MRKSQFVFGVGIWLLLVVTLGSYWPGLAGPFLLDDFHNLQPIAVYGGVDGVDDFLRYVFGAGGDTLSRSFARVTFLVDDQYWPSYAPLYKLNNVFLHLLSVALLALILVKVARIKSVLDNTGLLFAMLAVSLWALSPAQLSTVLYVVQRMTLLTTAGVLSTIYFYLCFRVVINSKLKSIYFVIAGCCFVLACLSKESALIALLLVPLIEIWLFTDRPKWLSVLLSLSVVSFFGLFCYSTIQHLGIFDGRVFGIGERFLLQGTTIFDYVILFFNVGATYTIFHDDIESGITAGRLIVGALAWVLHLTIIVLAIKKFRKWNIVAFGILWFYLCHIIESTVIPLELMFEHRNYLPSIGLAIVSAGALVKLYYYLVNRDLKLVAATLCLLFPVVFIGGLVYQAHIWSDYRILSSKWAADYPNSLRSQVSFVGMLEVNKMNEMALGKLEDMKRIFDDPLVDISYLVAQCRKGEQVDLVDPKFISTREFSSGVLYSLGEAINFDGECVDDNVLGGVNELIKAVGAMHLLKEKPRYNARYHDIIGNYFVKVGLYREAVESREKAWILQPTVATALKTAELFILGGNAELAKKYLDRAAELDASRWFRDRAVEKDISRLRSVIKIQEKGI